MLKAPTVGKTKSKAVFFQISYFMTCWSNIYRKTAQPWKPPNTYFFSCFFPTSDPQMWVNKRQKTSGRSKSSYKYNGSIRTPEHPLQGNPHEFQGPCSSPHSAAAGSAASWKIDGGIHQGEEQGKINRTCSVPWAIQGWCRGWVLSVRCVWGSTLLCLQKPGTTQHKCWYKYHL